MYPVETFYAEKPMHDYLETAVQTILKVGPRFVLPAILYVSQFCVAHLFLFFYSVRSKNTIHTKNTQNRSFHCL
jgi:hypothetical protein